MTVRAFNRRRAAATACPKVSSTRQICTAFPRATRPRRIRAVLPIADPGFPAVERDRRSTSRTLLLTEGAGCVALWLKPTDPFVFVDEVRKFVDSQPRNEQAAKSRRASRPLTWYQVLLFAAELTNV